VPDSSSPTDSATNTDDSHEENPFDPDAIRDFLVESEDMVEIAMSLRQISNVLESRTINHTMAGAATSESGFWLDDDYLYVEIENPESDELMMDICVHRGRAFIRVEREGLGVGLVELAV
jgi:hypothetical protein